VAIEGQATAAGEAFDQASAQGMTESSNDLLRLAAKDAETVAAALIADLENHPPHKRVAMIRLAVMKAFQHGKAAERLAYVPPPPDPRDIDVEALTADERVKLADKLFGPLMPPSWVRHG
jgi:hypothetical protein